jgi:hypothetical protein
MSSGLPRVILGAMLVLMLGVAAAACGDDDDGSGGETPGPDAEAYYSDVDRIQNSLTEQLDAIGEQSEQAYGDPDTARSSLSAAKAAGESALEDLSALEEPSVAATAHANLIAASEEMVAAVDGMIADLQGVEEGPEFDDFINSVLQTDSAYTLAAETMRDACAGMQDAYDNSRLQEIVFQCPI